MGESLHCLLITHNAHSTLVVANTRRCVVSSQDICGCEIKVTALDSERFKAFVMSTRKHLKSAEVGTWEMWDFGSEAYLGN